VALSDVNNVIVESYSYDVLGAPTIYDANETEISQSTIGNPYMFTARRADDETALYYYQARYYAFDIGRFLQTDPIGYADGLNLYAYVGNSPLQWVDPLGLNKRFRGFTPEQIEIIQANMVDAIIEAIFLMEQIQQAIAADQGQYPWFTNFKLNNALNIL
jgi:RHS repeat-associated protein